MCSLTIKCVLLHIHRMLFNTQQEREPEHGPRERGNRDREGRDEERGGGEGVPARRALDTQIARFRKMGVEMRRLL